MNQVRALHLSVKSESEFSTWLLCLIEIRRRKFIGLKFYFSDSHTLCSVVGILLLRMDLSLDALCEDLQSCFDPDPEATARATNLLAAQVVVLFICSSRTPLWNYAFFWRWRRLLCANWKVLLQRWYRKRRLLYALLLWLLKYEFVCLFLAIPSRSTNLRSRSRSEKRMLEQTV